jgi:hypothetical protein
MPLSKDIKQLVNYKIYRGDDPEISDFPIPKTVDALDEMDGFTSRLKFGARMGFLGGATLALLDIGYYTKLRDRRAQLLRFAWYTAPAILATTGYIAALEISKKTVETRKGAYVLAAAVPAGVAATWRRDVSWFPKTFVGVAAAGFVYVSLLEDNSWIQFSNRNPNNPDGIENKSIAFMNWPHKEHIGPNQESFGNFVPRDPGPTYTKWEK